VLLETQTTIEIEAPIEHVWENLIEEGKLIEWNNSGSISDYRQPILGLVEHGPLMSKATQAQ
jgi:hypothetical protein